MSLFGADLLFWTQPNAVGIAISVGICLLAAANLLIDFAVIEAGVESGAPAVDGVVRGVRAPHNARLALPGAAAAARAAPTRLRTRRGGAAAAPPPDPRFGLPVDGQPLMRPHVFRAFIQSRISRSSSPEVQAGNMSP